eukprot:3932070-Rhodomonas_salina.1
MEVVENEDEEVPPTALFDPSQLSQQATQPAPRPPSPVLADQPSLPHLLQSGARNAPVQPPPLAPDPLPVPSRPRRDKAHGPGA